MPSVYITFPLAMPIGIEFGMILLVISLYSSRVKALNKTIKEQEKEIDELKKSELKI